MHNVGTPNWCGPTRLSHPRFDLTLFLFLIQTHCRYHVNPALL